ncbi:hypothetical protein EXIGLDRAFT_831548 [Exidia glandulosa HHB12029]|uniref:Uncharacterized protein n=1 Tax=Exidia glandulosa HHB12029 TaxID=1314781 RepID=A0A165ML45_EXIGL|nr:hypothetical protein EXIGLDRAFT_831548 [Exidia glandulosa HHB12029]
MLLFVAVTAQNAGSPQLPDDEDICINTSVLEAFVESGSQNVTCLGEVTTPLRKGFNATISDCICPNSTLVTQVEDAVASLCSADAKARVQQICGNAALGTPSPTSTAGPSSSSSTNAAPGSSAGASGTTTGSDSTSTQTVTPGTGGGEAAVVVSKVMTGLAIFAPLLMGWM